MANRYTDEQRTEALAIFETQGAAAAAEVVGCHRSMIYTWLRASMSDDSKKDPEEIARDEQYQTHLRMALRRRWLESAHDLMDRIYQPHYEYMSTKDGPVRVDYELPRASDVKSYVTSAAIALDKFRLEMGEATGRFETVSQVDAELERMAREFNRTET